MLDSVFPSNYHVDYLVFSRIKRSAESANNLSLKKKEKRKKEK